MDINILPDRSDVEVRWMSSLHAVSTVIELGIEPRQTDQPWFSAVTACDDA